MFKYTYTNVFLIYVLFIGLKCFYKLQIEFLEQRAYSMEEMTQPKIRDYVCLFLSPEASRPTHSLGFGTRSQLVPSTCHRHATRGILSAIYKNTLIVGNIYRLFLNLTIDNIILFVFNISNKSNMFCRYIINRKKISFSIRGILSAI